MNPWTILGFFHESYRHTPKETLLGPAVRPAAYRGTRTMRGSAVMATNAVPAGTTASTGG